MKYGKEAGLNEERLANTKGRRSFQGGLETSAAVGVDASSSLTAQLAANMLGVGFAEGAGVPIVLGQDQAFPLKTGGSPPITQWTPQPLGKPPGESKALQKTTTTQ